MANRPVVLSKIEEKRQAKLLDLMEKGKYKTPRDLSRLVYSCTEKKMSAYINGKKAIPPSILWEINIKITGKYLEDDPEDYRSPNIARLRKRTDDFLAKKEAETLAVSNNCPKDKK